MTLSRDIQTLFDHFGGNADDYQEIGRENEARTARTRWPLLVSLDLTQPEIPAVAQRRDSAHAGKPFPTGEAQGDAAAAAVPRGRPLFARAHRRNIPPVENVTLPVAPAGAPRFSAAPDAVPESVPEEHAPPSAAGIASAASAPATLSTHMPIPSPASTHPVQARVPLATPMASPHAASSFGSFTPAAPVAPRPLMPATAPAPSASFSSNLSRPAAPAPSILGKLFQPTPPQAQPQPAPHAHYAPPASTAQLQSMFDRLRGTPSRPAFGTAAVPAPADRNAPRTPAPAGNAWLTRGPRRP